ncbi:glycoside hydrolase family protein [Fodinicola feengrottensis]|uniref:hypothetical protein n=1 Tax=Fodinicola feengrottensis TaxID=435914 RepID=UPI0013D7BAB1|nr:hypothetical protein [Fodinicola feengrottensis]
MTHTTPELRVTGKKVLFEGVADVTVTHRRGREWMALGSMTPGDKAIGLQSAHIQRNSGEWSIDSTPLAKFPPAHAWDATGYHCASYVRGRVDGEWRGRIYYASSSSWTDITGPYQIGFLEFDGTGWRRHSEPVFQASLPWERGTVLEPNLVYEGGLWRMWYCTGLSTSEPPTIGYAESADGITDWRGRKVVSTGNFDAAVTAIDRRRLCDGHRAPQSDRPAIGRRPLPLVQRRPGELESRSTNPVGVGRHALAPRRRVEAFRTLRIWPLHGVLQCQ